MIVAYSFGDFILWSLWVFFLVVWIWVLISVITDLFRDHELSGGMKFLWVLFLLLVPFLAVLIYVIVRGHGMAQRSARAHTEAQEAVEQYIRSTAGAGDVADQITKLQDLREKGAISDEEFEQAKAKLLG